MTAKEKIARNNRVQIRYDALSTEGYHGHYEIMFRVVREEVEAERARCAEICKSYAMRHAKDDMHTKAQAWMMLQCAAFIRYGDDITDRQMLDQEQPE